MRETHRPSDYLEYRDAAAAILAREPGDPALAAFGLTEVFAAAGPADLTPVYAFLEAQGGQVARTSALARLGTVGLGGPAAGALFGVPVGAGPLTAVPGLTASAGSPVAVDHPGVGLVVTPADGVRVHPDSAAGADGYVVLAELDPAARQVVLPDEEAAALRPALTARVQLGAAAELLGACRRILDDAIAYAQIRRQFGRPLSTFQAMQHLLAWGATEHHQLTAMFDIAVAQAARQGTPDPLLSAAVKALAGRVAHTLVQTATQVTGAISFTWEYGLRPLHHRTLALDQFAGSSADLLATMGRHIRADGALPELFGLESVAAAPLPPSLAG